RRGRRARIDRGVRRRRGRRSHRSGRIRDHARGTRGNRRRRPGRRVVRASASGTVLGCGRRESRVTRIAVVGEALVDVVVGGDSHAGGSPMNVAVGLTRLGYPSELNAWIGSDGHGDLIRAHLAADGVPLGAGTRSEGPSWTASVELDADGRAEYAFRLHGDISVPAIDEYELVHTGSIGALRE